MLATWPNVASTVENFDRLARAYAAQERYDDALRTLQRALERHPRGEHVERMTDAMRTYREKSAPSEPPGPSE
jgi:cytochrome c-type biogenesis protein CcmH/NrfG